MWLAEGKKNLSLQMVQLYKLQKQPLVQIYNYQSKLIFGSYNEPIERMQFSYVDNSYKTYMFLSRNDEDAKHGIIPALYETFYFNRIADLKIFGPKNILFFLSLIHQIMGPKISAFPVLEMHKDGTYISKYGIKQRQQQELTNFLKIQNKLYFDVEEINRNMKTYVKDYIDPLSFVQNGYIQFDKNMQIIPIHQNDNLIQYLIKQTPTVDLKEARYILILNIQSESECEEFIEIVLPKIKKYQQNDNKFILIHQTNDSIIETPSYRRIVHEFQKEKPQMINIIASMNYFKDIPKLERQEMYRDKSNLYHLEYLVQMKECIPQLFEGRGQINKFSSKNQVPLKNIDELWSDSYHKVLASNYRSIDLQKDFISFEKIKQARDIRFMPHNQDLQKLKFYSKNIPISQQYNFKLTILGTSSSILTIKRSTSSYLLNLKGFDILLDCGQCTLFQIYQNSENDEKFKQKLIDLKLIFISHFHIDHHGGLYELLEKRYQFTKAAIQLIIPNNLFLWFHYSLTTLVQNTEGHSDYQKYFKIYSHRQFFDNFFNMFGPTIQIPKFDSQQVHNISFLKEYLDKYNIEIKLINTQHCKHSMGIKITFQGKSIVYSADREAQNEQLQKEFIDTAMDCDLLIHECTYPDSEIQKASQNNHSTFYHAVSTAKQCNARMLLLTHFNYDIITQLKSHFDSEGQVDVNLCPKHYEYIKSNTIFANDFMSITDKNMQLLPQLSRLIFSIL